jgi:hypothetical protein
MENAGLHPLIGRQRVIAESGRFVHDSARAMLEAPAVAGLATGVLLIG